MIYSETVFPLFITEDVECNNLENSIREKKHYFIITRMPSKIQDLFLRLAAKCLRTLFEK